MTTLFDVLVQAARSLDAMQDGAATNGTTTTIVDSNLPLIGWTATDDFDGGWAALVWDAGGAGAAPQGQSRMVSAYDGNGTLTFGTAFSVAPAVGDRYGICTGRYPRETMAAKLNEFLAELGDVPTEDTSITTAAATLEYSLPNIGSKQDLREVWIATNTAQPYYWTRLATYRHIYADPGATGKLIFPYQPTSGLKLKLVYMAPHAQVYLDTSAISDYIGRDWAALEVALRCARWRLDQPGEDRDSLIAKINDLLQQAARAQRRRRPRTPAPTPIFPYFPGN